MSVVAVSYSLLFCLCSIIANSVFGIVHEVKSLLVMEGDSVTLHTDLPEIQTADLIQWKFVTNACLIAEIHKKANSSLKYDDDASFKGKLQLDDQTGSLTITNISMKNSGEYKLVINSRKTYAEKFIVMVYARLPVPVISKDFSHSTSKRSSKCVLLCSVMNVTHVSLSWYKENSLLTRLSVSDLNIRFSEVNIRLSLPLVVEYQDNNTYSCVINNPIKNQTTHLRVSDLCKDDSQQLYIDYAMFIGVVIFNLCIMGLV